MFCERTSHADFDWTPGRFLRICVLAAWRFLQGMSIYNLQYGRATGHTSVCLVAPACL